MPIVDVEIVLNQGEAARAALASDLADAIGRVFESPKGKTWVRLRTLPRDAYSENGGLPDYAQPVFVRVLKAQRPEGDALLREVRNLTHAVAAAVGRSGENVHVLYEPDARGRIAFGGELVQ